MIGAFTRGDFDAALACIAPDAKWDTSMPGVVVVDAPRELNGREGVRDFFRRWLGTWSGYTYEQRRLVDGDGNKVVSVFAERGTGRGSGLTIEKERAGIYEVRDGMVVSWTRYSSPSEAFQAAGLQE